MEADAHAKVNRHTGGLEKDAIDEALNFGVNRHTGGLEKRPFFNGLLV